jgi:hypothetical protein
MDNMEYITNGLFEAQEALKNVEQAVAAECHYNRRGGGILLQLGRKVTAIRAQIKEAEDLLVAVDVDTD